MCLTMMIPSVIYTLLVGVLTYDDSKLFPTSLRWYFDWKYMPEPILYVHLTIGFELSIVGKSVTKACISFS